MPGIICKLLILLIIIFNPVNLWASRGAGDYGIIMTVMFIFYSLPIGLLLICFIIYSFIKIKSVNKPNANNWKGILFISLILIIPTVIVPLFMMYRENWHPRIVELMLADFIPILILSIISATLAIFVKKRSLDNNKIYIQIAKKQIFKNAKTKYLLLGLILIIIAVLLFYLFFMG